MKIRYVIFCGVACVVLALAGCLNKWSITSDAHIEADGGVPIDADKGDQESN